MHGARSQRGTSLASSHQDWRPSYCLPSTQRSSDSSLRCRSEQLARSAREATSAPASASCLVTLAPCCDGAPGFGATEETGHDVAKPVDQVVVLVERRVAERAVRELRVAV